ncbi:hypothetical protein C3E97_030625 [Pseudomonas sp. MWU12-2115]|uniref:Uncharacterized protein n=1 Tax=Chromobacterium sinusclupearum TaxID=2077146 RepID=A0A2K4MRV3_9NEIS|nr:hypothetical protein [Chromobacterium sinusclupearum]POA99828.1 hypothetical protein C2134_04450 [Chromobacterium sinusclupearum]RBB96192.1 hypothetical protein C3E97_030625 [Pseudomonas sp. MWU12-2115]
MIQPTPILPANRIGTITLHLFDNGVAEAIIENPGRPLQDALARCMGRLIHEAGIIRADKLQQEAQA